MPTKTIAELKALVDTRLPTNNAGAIDAATLRSVIDDILDNEQVALSGILTSAGTPSSTTFLRGDNVWAAPAAGGTFSGTGDPGLTRAQAAATTFTTPPVAIRTTGYATPGDWGGSTYLKVTSQPTHKGWFQTVDGTYYELYPDRGYVSPQMFGGQSPTPDYNSRSNDIGSASNDAVDYIIFNRFGKVDLYYPPGSYYIATTVQLKGGGFNVRGSNASAGGAGTYIMTDYYTTGFVGHHGVFSFDVFGSVYFNNRGVELGEMVYNGGLFGNHTYICTQAGTTSADGSGHPTGTGNGQIDGTAKWDYYREASRVELTGTAWGGEFSHIFLYSHYDGSPKTGGSWLAQTNYPAVGPWSQKPSGQSAACGPWKPAFGFLGRARAHVHHCWMGGFSALGAAFISNGDTDFPTITGNVNGWAIDHCAFYYNAMDGMHNSYSDGNAGYTAHIDLSSNGRWGYKNQGFLGDGIFQIQSAFDGRASVAGNQRFPTSVAHAGYYYYPRLGQLGTSGTPDYGAIAPTPGASNNAWVLLGGDGTWATDNWNYPDWVSGYTYEAGGAFASNNVNARHTWINCYIEGGTWPAQFDSRDVTVGGLMQELFIGAGSNTLQDGNWYNPINFKSRGHNFSCSLGYGGTYSDKGEGMLMWKDTSDNEYARRTDSYENDGATFATDNYTWAINRFPQGYWLKNGQTSKFYGKPSAADGGTFVYNKLIFGSDGDGRQLDFADSIPTSGNHAQGERVYKKNAAVGQPKGWVCTVAGTPGTWVSLGNL